MTVTATTSKAVDQPAATPLAAEIARVYGTPAVVIDLDKVDANIARLQAACDAAGVANRPHIKTHKSPELARLQIEAGARGITCQKLGEAEIMAENGHDDILIAYNILGEEKLRIARHALSILLDGRESHARPREGFAVARVGD